VFELPALISLRVQGLKGQSCQILRCFLHWCASLILL
jgi:hypothetical protein